MVKADSYKGNTVLNQMDDDTKIINLQLDGSDTAYHENGFDLLPLYDNNETAPLRQIKRSKVVKHQIPLVQVKFQMGATVQKYEKNSKVMLEFNHTEDRDVLAVLWQDLKIIKMSMQLEEKVRNILEIMHHKCLQCQIVKTRPTTTKRKGKTRTNDENNTKRLITKLYKDIVSSDIILSFNDETEWQLTFTLQLSYTPQALNKFSKETCRFLDAMFSRIEYWNNDKPPNPTSFIQKDFVKQAVQYTKTNVDYRKPELFEVDGLKAKLLPFQSKSVAWMIAKERECLPQVNFDDPSDLLHFLNRYVSFGYESISSTKFWNKFTNFILSDTDVREIYNNISKLQKEHHAIGSKGLLSEEMGLGKTIEILALIIENKRALENGDTFIDNDGKTIFKTKTTLIICPNAILQQWINEIESHTTKKLKIFHYKGFLHVKKYFKCENIHEIVKILSDCDIIITSYNIVSTEIHYAEYNASLRPRRSASPIKYDYSSPLSLMQFFRIILDEVQMLHSDSTKAAKCTSLLHRLHTWGVSGTPIQFIRDYQTVLSYLKISPYFELPEIILTLNLNVIYKRDQFINGIRFCLGNLMSYFVKRDLCIRHRKNDVLDQIKVPKQHNYLVPLEFSPVEWDNYLDLWNSFLESSRYNSNGTGTTGLSNLQLNQWLTRLRYVCCHAIHPDQNINPKTAQGNWNPNMNSLLNIDDVLKLMTSDATDKLDSLYRDSYQLQIKSAQAKMELQDNPQQAIDYLKSIQETLITDLKVKFQVDNVFSTDIFLEEKHLQDITAKNLENNNKMRIRAYLDLLHQCYFFLGTGYYLMGSNKLEKLDNENEKLQITGSEMIPKTYAEHFSKEEMEEIEKYQQFEQKFYSCAEQLRERILLGRVQKVESVINDTQKYFEEAESRKEHGKTCLEIIPFDHTDDFSNNVFVSRCFKMMSSLIDSLNKQANQFNNLGVELLTLLYKPIRRNYTEENEDEKGNEYSTSVEDQDKMFTIFACLEQLLYNRDLIITSDENVKNTKKKMKSLPEQTFSKYHHSLFTKLNLISGTPMKQVFDDLKNSRIVRNVSGNTENNKNSDSFEEYLLEYEERMNNLTKENNNLRDSLKRLNNIYNAKLEYYSHLQRISDSLVSLLHWEQTARNNILKSVRDDYHTKNAQKIATAESRVKYLNSLNELKEGIAKNQAFQCPICLGNIDMGAIIKCGHFFCRKCIASWLKQHDTCPLCKTTTALMEIYNFKFRNLEDNVQTNKSDLESEQIKKPELADQLIAPNIEHIFKKKYTIYSQLNEVHKIHIKESFGAKIDFVIKLILFLRMRGEAENGEAPQILLYSQSFDYLKVISKVLHLHNILHLTCLSNTANIGEMISKFKRDNTITCLLLNVKALGAGLNLLNAKHVFLLDPIINHGDELQAMSRNNRIGQTHETYVWNFMIKNTVEENILKYKCVLEDRRRKMNQITEEQQGISEETNSEFEMNESTGEQVAEKHLWHCFFESTNPNYE